MYVCVCVFFSIHSGYPVIYVVANPVRGLLDRKISEGHLQSLGLNLVLLTYGIPPEFRGGIHFFIYNRHTPSCQFRVYRVTQLRTDGVHCRESAGTGPVNIKVVSKECCLGQVTMDQLIFASFSDTHH